MAGIALLSDLLRRSPPAASSVRSLFPGGVLSATVAASIAGISASRSLISDGGASTAFCDAGVAWKDDYVPDLLGAKNNIFTLDSIKYSTKQYPIELKPLFSAFGLKSFTIISLRSFLLFYLPLLEPRPVEDDDFPLESESRTVDLVVPFKKSVKQIVRETTVITTRRMLERLAFHYVSQRMAWKLLKDVSRSAKRKSTRGWSASFFIFSVSRTTLRGQLLGIVANWLVQIGIETYGCLFRKSPDDVDCVAETGKIRILGRKITGATFRCCGSLVFASIGAGIGALFYPSIGQWIGCAIGDFGGPIIVAAFFEQYLHLSI